MVHGLGTPEIVDAQPFNPKLCAQFLDAVFEVGPAVVLAPDGQSVHAPGQVASMVIPAVVPSSRTEAIMVVMHQ